MRSPRFFSTLRRLLQGAVQMQVKQLVANAVLPRYNAERARKTAQTEVGGWRGGGGLRRSDTSRSILSSSG